MLVQDLIIIFALILIGIGWWHDRGIKQQAYNLVKSRCAMLEVQLLDDNVRLTRMRLKRHSSSGLTIERNFSFEFTSDGDTRYSGRMTMEGNRLIHIETDAYRIQPTIH